MTGYPSSPSGETLRTYRIGYCDRAVGRETVVEPVVIGPFPIATANYYADDVFARLRSLPADGLNVERRWSIAMEDTNPTGDFPADAVVKWQCIMTPWVPVAEANQIASEVLSRLKPQGGWGGSR